MIAFSCVLRDPCRGAYQEFGPDEGGWDVRVVYYMMVAAGADLSRGEVRGKFHCVAPLPVAPVKVPQRRFSRCGVYTGLSRCQFEDGFDFFDVRLRAERFDETFARVVVRLVRLAHLARVVYRRHATQVRVEPVKVFSKDAHHSVHLCDAATAHVDWVKVVEPFFDPFDTSGPTVRDLAKVDPFPAVLRGSNHEADSAGFTGFVRGRPWLALCIPT